MKKSLFFLLLLVNLIYAQTFIRTYHFPGMTGGLGLSKCTDGGFVGTGQHENGPAGSCDIYVYRVSNCGNILWYKTFGTGGSDGGKAVIQASDGGFLVSGLYDYDVGNGYDYFLMKLDAAGIVQWNTVWDGGDNDYNVWAEETPFGIATCGWSYNGTNWDGIVGMYTSGGAPVWFRRLIGGGNDNPSTIHLQGSNFWVGGSTSSYGAGAWDFMVLKLDLSGNLIFAKAYGTSANEGREWDIKGIPSPDGGYVMAGYTSNAVISAGSNDIVVFKVNGAGNLLWAYRYGGTGEEVAESINLTHDGGFIVTGYTYSFGNGGRDAFVLKLDSLGNMQWAKSYGAGGNDRGVSVINIGKEYVISMNYDYGSADYDPMFVKVDSLGNVGCNVTNAPFAQLDILPNMIVTNIPAANYQNFSVSPYYPSPLSGAPSVSESFLCISCSATTPTINVTPTVVCEGSPVTLTNLSNTTSAVCFEWLSNGSPLPVSGLGSQTITLTPGTYQIELKATCGNTVNSVQQMVIVNPKPTANFSYTDHICVDNQPVNYINTGSSGGSYSYQWYLGNGASPSTTTSANANNIFYAFGGSKDVSLVVTNSYGCKDSISKTVNIEPLPSLVFSATTPNCVSDTVFFTNTSWVGGTGVITNWYWDFGDGNNSNAFQPSHLYSSPGTYTVMLSATSDYGCDDTLYQTIVVSPTTIPGNVSSNDTVCAIANSGTLSVSGNNGNVQYWEYSTDGGVNWYAISNTSTSQTYSNLPVTTIYRAYVQSGSCPGAYTSPNATITVYPGSEAGVLLKDTSVCETGNNGTLSLTNYTGSVQDWYFSTNNGGSWTALGNSNTNYSFSNLNTTTWYYAIVKSGVCPDDTSNIVVVNVSPATIPGNVLSSQTVCVLGNSGTLTLNSYTGSILGWETSTDGGLTWYPVSNTSTVQSFSNLTTTTLFRVKVKSGVCPEGYSGIATIQVDAASVGGKILQDTVVCYGVNTGTLSLVSYSTNILDWIVSNDNGMSWTSLSNTNPVYVFNNLTDTMWYKAIVQNGVCPADTSQMTIVFVNLFQGASVVPYPDTSISMGYSVQLVADGGVNYLWSPNYNISDTTIFNPFVWPIKDTVYSVYVFDKYGCVDTATVKIFVLKDIKLIIANTMTPNGDGYNDFFWIGMIEFYPNNEVIIFNRYGQEIFKGKDYDNKKVFWDGTYQGSKVPDGAYYYVIKFKENNTVFKGSINVISSN